jgi:uncharacterized DUF497 family protein
VDIEFDPAKDRRNLAKHGISLRRSRDLSWEELIVMSDPRFDYGEARYIGYGRIGVRLYCIVFVHRRHSLRVISLRKANKREVLRHDQAKESAD